MEVVPPNLNPQSRVERKCMNSYPQVWMPHGNGMRVWRAHARSSGGSTHVGCESRKPMPTEVDVLTEGSRKSPSGAGMVRRYGVTPMKCC